MSPKVQDVMSFELAQAIALDTFHSLRPVDQVPQWLAGAATLGGFKDAQKRWTMSLTLTPRIALEPNEAWEDRGGRRVLTRIHPVTGEKRIVISRPSPEPVVVFSATIDPVQKTVTVLVDVDPATLDADQFEQ